MRCGNRCIENRAQERASVGHRFSRVREFEERPLSDFCGQKKTPAGGARGGVAFA
jgi:hypothetical protein